MRLLDVCLVAAGAAVAAIAAPNKGVQAVLMQCWNDSSTANLISAIRSSGVREIEISLSPFLDSRCKLPGKASGTDAKDKLRFANINRAITELTGAGIEVRTVLFIGNFKDSAVRSDLGKRAARAWNHVVEGKSNLASFQFSPALEDRYRNEATFKKALDKMKSGLSEAKVAALNNRFVFRRNPLSFVKPAMTSYQFGNTTVKVRHEIHGSDSHAGEGYNYYSNDGTFVSYHDDKCLQGCYGEPMSMKDFREKRTADVKLLWRPAYNLSKRQGVDFVLVQSSNRADTGQCNDTENECTFNRREVAALKAFLD